MLDLNEYAIKNSYMNANLVDDTLAEVCRLRAANLPIPPELAQQIDYEADLIRAEVFAKHGLLNIAVDLIREARSQE